MPLWILGGALFVLMAAYAATVLLLLREHLRMVRDLTARIMARSYGEFVAGEAGAMVATVMTPPTDEEEADIESRRLKERVAQLDDEIDRAVIPDEAT